MIFLSEGVGITVDSGRWPAERQVRLPGSAAGGIAECVAAAGLSLPASGQRADMGCFSNECRYDFALMHSMSSLIHTSSPTTSPPLSNALFQTMPKSFRFTLPSAVKPARVLPHGS